jgi:hypothetical protein
MKKFDVLLKKAELFEKLSIHGDRKSFLQSLSQQDWSDVARQEGDLPESVIPPVPPVRQETPAIVAPPPPVSSNAPSISQPALYAVQNYLNKDTLNEMPPITPDGKWGPETSGRVLYWAKKNKLNLSLQDLVDLLKTKAATQTTQNTPNLDLAKYTV